MKTNHNGIEIEYDEKDNVWRFTLRGRDRSAGSLAKAKEAIDAPPPKNSKPFERIPCMVKHWAYGWVNGEVTSIAEYARHGSAQVWVSLKGSGCSREREKLDSRSVYLLNDENQKLVAEMKGIDADIARLNKERGHKEDRMQPIKIEAEEKP